MPIYEYECTKCGQVIEAWQKFSDPPLDRCEACGGKVRKLISHSTFHLKGSGWYVTDYGSRSSSTGTSAKTDTGKKETSKTEKKTDKANKDGS